MRKNDLRNGVAGAGRVGVRHRAAAWNRGLARGTEGPADAARASTLVAFSCKQRGLCPSCGARRSHESAIHCEQVLPVAGYRQWTLSAPYRLTWALVKDARLFAAMERRLVRAI